MKRYKIYHYKQVKFRRICNKITNFYVQYKILYIYGIKN